ncbi:MetQ/NlpA family ABC transporter substrate-binding protein [Brachyspira pulli]|uniref:MetQ/NlpA family ABC transporter substrate-binding protein n=1 Tax=Brachyspira pulli TaxID=310721 RepID=UPI00300655FC
MTKYIFKTLLLLTITALLFISCSEEKNNNNKVIKIAHVGMSDNLIWQPIIEKLEKEGIQIELVDFYDYNIPNRALNDGDVHLNAFQHHAYLNDEVAKYGYKIVPIADTYISAMNIYSKFITNINQIKMGDKVMIPQDPSNTGRALKVLEAAGLIKIKDEAGDFPTTNDIIENRLNIEIIEIKSIDMYTVINDVACAVINANYAVDLGFNPGVDYIFQDDSSIYEGDSFINLIAARTKDKNNETYKKIIEAYQSDDMKQIYKEKFSGAYIPAWEKK